MVSLLAELKETNDASGMTFRRVPPDAQNLPLTVLNHSTTALPQHNFSDDLTKCQTKAERHVASIVREGLPLVQQIRALNERVRGEREWVRAHGTFLHDIISACKCGNWSALHEMLNRSSAPK